MPRVLIAEDSATTRNLLVEILRSDADITIVGEATNGAEAVEMTKRLRPDIVTMDIRMPGMDGFQATKQIMVEAPTPIVIVSASVDVHEVEVSMHALRAGALTVVPKPLGPHAPDFDDVRRRFVATIKSMSQVKVVRRWAERGRPSRAPGEERRSEPYRQTRIVALAASTGGPAALCQVLSGLPGDFPLPILVVQHIAHGFASGFASWLSTNLALRAKVAESGERLEPRVVYVAPDDRHLGVSDAYTVQVSNAPAIGGFRPSASFLFQTVAKTFGRAALAVVLTGMGEDGLDGLYAVRDAGGQIIAQDERSSVVFGMPGVAVAAGIANATLPLELIGPRILQVGWSLKGDT